MSKLKVLSLCDGASAGLMAFKVLGVEVQYHAVEIDPHARKLSDSNFPGEILRWADDITKVTKEDIELYGPFDWVIFGTPCQSLSVAGRQEGFNGESKLLFNALQILEWCYEQNNEVKFLSENVKMKQDFLDEYDKAVNLFYPGVVYRKLINSADLSAQRRERYYWTNFPVGVHKITNEKLKDILEDDVESSLYLKPKDIKTISDARVVWGEYNNGKPSQQNRAHNPENKSPTVSSNRGVINIFQFLKEEEIGSKAGIAYSSSIREGGVIESRARVNDKANTLTTGNGCAGGLKSLNVVAEVGIFQRPRGYNKGNIHTEKTPTVGSSSWEQNNLLTKIEDGEIVFRKLSVRECARLQKFPEWYKFDAVSKTQAYKAIGNSWTVSVIEHILASGLWKKNIESWEYL